MKKHVWKDKSLGVLLTKLGLTVVGMFVFAVFIMPPMYDLFCDITGLNGKTKGQYTGSVNELGVDTSRKIKVQFIANNNENMPWIFRPIDKVVYVHPGEAKVINYFVRNTTKNNMVGQAVPSLVPYKAASYFHKTECFCFNQQPLVAGESAELGLSFIVDIDIPKQVNTITLSYTLFDITQENQSENGADLKTSLFNNENEFAAYSANL